MRKTAILISLINIIIQLCFFVFLFRRSDTSNKIQQLRGWPIISNTLDKIKIIFSRSCFQWNLREELLLHTQLTFICALKRAPMSHLFYTDLNVPFYNSSHAHTISLTINAYQDLSVHRSPSFTLSVASLVCVKTLLREIPFD